jgi:hypothetical protein
LLITKGITKKEAKTNLKNVKKNGDISFTAIFVNTHAEAPRNAISNIIKNQYMYFFFILSK